MPRNPRGRLERSGFDGIKDRVVRVPFRVQTGTSISKVNDTKVFSELEIVPANLGTRVAAIAPNFEYYRVEKLSVCTTSSVCNAVHYDSDVLNVTLGTLSGIMATAYEPSDTTRTAVPTSFGGMANSACYNYGSFKDRFVMNVPKSVLLGAPLKWWNTSSTGSPTETLVQGLVWTATHNFNEQSATIADVCVTLVEGIIAFKGMIDPALSFESKELEPTQKSWDVSSGVIVRDDAGDDLTEARKLAGIGLSMPKLRRETSQLTVGRSPSNVKSAR